DQPARVFALAMLEQVEPLPGAERQGARDHRDRDRALREHRSDVRWHVVGPLFVVLEVGVTVGNQAAKEALEIASHRRVGVLAQDQRGAGVLQEAVAQSLAHERRAHDAIDLGGDVLGAALASWQGELDAVDHDPPPDPDPDPLAGGRPGTYRPLLFSFSRTSTEATQTRPSVLWCTQGCSQSWKNFAVPSTPTSSKTVSLAPPLASSARKSSSKGSSPSSNKV